MFRKTLVFAALFTVLLTAVMNSTAFAQSSVVPIHLIRDRGKTFTVHPNQIIVLWRGWGACTPGLVRAWFNAENVEITLNGSSLFSSPKDVKQYWGSIGSYTDPPFPKPPLPLPPYYCANQKPLDTIPAAYWVYELGNLTLGDYRLHYTQSVDRWFIDGGDWDRDGQIDHNDGWWREAWITIKVIP